MKKASKRRILFAGCSPAEYSSYEHERKEFDPEIYQKCEKYLKEKEGRGDVDVANKKEVV